MIHVQSLKLPRTLTREPVSPPVPEPFVSCPLFLSARVPLFTSGTPLVRSVTVVLFPPRLSVLAFEAFVLNFLPAGSTSVFFLVDKLFLGSGSPLDSVGFFQLWSWISKKKKKSAEKVHSHNAASLLILVGFGCDRRLGHTKDCKKNAAYASMFETQYWGSDLGESFGLVKSDQ